MTTVTSINMLREFIFARANRIAAIQKRTNELRSKAPTMTLKELEAAKNEVSDLRKEVAEHEEFIKQAKDEIAAFYRPATFSA